jgi:hypothetical protein
VSLGFSPTYLFPVTGVKDKNARVLVRGNSIFQTSFLFQSKARRIAIVRDLYYTKALGITLDYPARSRH